MTEKVSILFGTVDRFSSVCKLIDSIERLTQHSNYEIIVVDGGTDKNLSRWLAEKPNVKYHKEETPQGFARAYNKGAALADGKWLIWLNDDCEVTEGWLTKIVSFMEATPAEVGLGGIPFTDGGSEQLCYQRMYNKYTANFGCISLALWRSLGGFDERYHSYGAETDLNFRVLQSKLEVVVIPDVHIHHVRINDALRKTLSSGRKQGFELFVKIWGGSELAVQPIITRPVHRNRQPRLNRRSRRISKRSRTKRSRI